MDNEEFERALIGTRIPILILDQKWHRLFAIDGKPEEILLLERELKELLERQGKLNTELKACKQLKNDLMANIMENMDGQVNASQKSREDSKKLIDETNAKIQADEEELTQLPSMINEKNHDLMMATMVFCYEHLRTNKHEIEEIGSWIDQIRVELKKNIIKKQNREINNREIYYYMHDIFGKDVCDLFDVHFEEEELTPPGDGTVVKKEKKEGNEQS